MRSGHAHSDMTFGFPGFGNIYKNFRGRLFHYHSTRWPCYHGRCKRTSRCPFHSDERTTNQTLFSHSFPCLIWVSWVRWLWNVSEPAWQIMQIRTIRPMLLRARLFYQGTTHILQQVMGSLELGKSLRVDILFFYCWCHHQWPSCWCFPPMAHVFDILNIRNGRWWGDYHRAVHHCKRVSKFFLNLPSVRILMPPYDLP